MQIIVPPLGGLSFGTVGTAILSGAGDPNQGGTDSPNGNISAAGVGSLFLRTDAPDSTHALYVKTSFVSGAPGTWTAK